MEDNHDNISYDNPNSEKRQFSEEKDKYVYFTQLNFSVFLFFIIFFIVCSIIIVCIFILYLNGNNSIIYYIFFPLMILIVSAIFTSSFPLFSKIIVDIPNELIIIKKIAILFCFNNANYINLKEVEQITIDKNTNINYEIGGFKYGGYNLIFIINKDKVIKGLTGEIDKNFESQKLFEFLRESIPKNIPISSDMMEINELYPNLNTQRIVGSTTVYSNLNESIPAPALSFE